MSLSLQQKQSFQEIICRQEKRLEYALFHHVSTRGKNLSFEGRPWQMALYLDKAQKIVIRKCVQVGMTEWLIIDTLSNCERALSTFYVLPTFNLRNTFVKNRIDKLFNSVPYYAYQLKHAEGDADSMSIKHYSEGTIKFVGSNTPKEFVEFPADAVVIDEYDQCEQENLALAPDRIKSSEYKLQRKVGNPSFEDFGIDEEFKLSDQKEWMIKCNRCGHWQPLDFFLQVVEEVSENVYEIRDKAWTISSGRDIECFCIKCGKPFDRLSRSAEWVRKNESSKISGYHFTRMMDQHTTIEELYEIFQAALTNPTKMQAFYNSDLGLPYSAKSVALSDFLLKACEKDYSMPSSSSYCVMGVDVGSILNVKISKVDGQKRIAQYIGTVHTFEALDPLIENYGVVVCVIDALPETHKAKELRDRHPGKVYLCEYPASPKGTVAEMRIDDEEMIVKVDRTQSLDESHSDILLKRMILPTGAKNIEGFYEQMKKPKRVFDEKSGRYIWTDEKPDHYRHADNYEKIAQKILGEEPHLWVISED